MIVLVCVHVIGDAEVSLEQAPRLPSWLCDSSYKNRQKIAPSGGQMRGHDILFDIGNHIPTVDQTIQKLFDLWSKLNRQSFGEHRRISKVTDFGDGILALWRGGDESES